ncbi:MAG: hypothetical protein H0V42_03280 [Nocardioidaceae bacterium]|nr:hypothetical protein [Nocardioidaceae bacterium]
MKHVADFEAEAAIALESVARSATDSDLEATGPYRFGLPRVGQDAGAIDVACVVQSVVADVRAERPPADIALAFHHAVTRLVMDLAEEARSTLGLDTVALGGGVFQNALLLGAAKAELEHEGFTVLVPQRLPPNDAGLALGQILVAAAG